MKLSFYLLALFSLALASEAATQIYKRQSGPNGKKRLVVRKRQRGNRQLFGNRVVVPFAPAPALRFAPAPQPIVHSVAQPFVQPQPIRVVEVNPANYFAAANPAPVPAPAPVAAPVQPAAPIIQVRQEPVFTAPVTVASAPAPAAKPIAITRSVYNAPGTIVDSLNTWDYAFESENGIKQQAAGEMKTIGEDEVVVMRGSYQYIGVDGLTYTVDWEADELGFRASAPHLPKPVEIPFPEQAEAVAAQLRFAASEPLVASASTPIEAYALPA